MRAADEVVERLVALDRLGERASAAGAFDQSPELALVGLLERLGLGVSLIEVARDARIVEAGIEVVEVPLRQIPKRRAGCRFGAGLGPGFGLGGLGGGLLGGDTFG